MSLIDTAPAYGLGRSEEIVGKAIAGRRDEVVLATKCGLVWRTDAGRHFLDQDGRPVHRYLGPESIRHELDASLRRLGTDRIDLYITHWQDPTTPVAETLAALEELKRAGKIRAIGASNVSAVDVEAFVAAGRLDAIQEQFSMVHRDVAGGVTAAAASATGLAAGTPVVAGLFDVVASALGSGAADRARPRSSWEPGASTRSSPASRSWTPASSWCRASAPNG